MKYKKGSVNTDNIFPPWRSETSRDGNGCATLPHQNLGA